jgi:hypothetical protein
VSQSSKSLFSRCSRISGMIIYRGKIKNIAPPSPKLA